MNLDERSEADNIPVWHCHIVEETLRRWGSVGKQTSIFALTGLAQAVSAGVPENFLAFGRIERNVRHLRILLKWPVQVPKLAVDFGNNNVGAQLLRDILQQLGRSGLEGLCSDGGRLAIAEIDRDVNIWVGLVLELLQILLPELLEELVALNNEIGEIVGGSRSLFGRRLWRGLCGGVRSRRSLGRPGGEVLGTFRSHVYPKTKPAQERSRFCIRGERQISVDNDSSRDIPPSPAINGEGRKAVSHVILSSFGSLATLYRFKLPTSKTPQASLP